MAVILTTFNVFDKQDALIHLAHRKSEYILLVYIACVNGPLYESSLGRATDLAATCLACLAARRAS